MTPVYMTSTFVQSSPGVFKDGYDYARSKNPTRTALEANLASLEGGKHGMAFSSGLGAMDCVLHQLRHGDHVVLSDDVYGGSYRLIDKIFRHHGLECTRVDMTTIGAVEVAASDSGTSSSMNPVTAAPTGTLALVPVMKNPAGRNTIAETATAPTPPATPLSSKPPVMRIWRPLTVT